VHERATFAALCGSLRGMLPAARGWEDYLWAHLRAALEWRADDALASLIDNDVDVDESGVELDVDVYRRRRAQLEPAPPRSVADALALLRHANVPLDVRRGANDAFHRVQTLVLLHSSPDTLLIALSRLLTPGGGGDSGVEDVESMPLEHVSPQLLRFGAHVALFFNANGLPMTRQSQHNNNNNNDDDATNVDDDDDDDDDNDETSEAGARAAERLLRAYADHLARTDSAALLAQYAALLPTTEAGVAL
jgi:hypothetical protein